MAKIELEGMDELIKQINAIGERVATRAENKALREGAKVLQEETSRRAPRSSASRSPSGRQKWRTGQHAADNIGVSNVRTDKDGTKYVLVGITKGDNSPYFYLKFHEWGTTKMSARPFMGPAIEEKRSEIFGTMAGVLRGEIEKRQ